MNKKIKNNKGFTTIDAAIAVVVLTIFIPVVTTLIYNIAITSKSVERKAKAVNYAIQYLEYAKMQDASPKNLDTFLDTLESERIHGKYNNNKQYRLNKKSNSTN